MAAQDSKQLRMYRISVAVGGDVVVQHERGWNDTDALRRLQARLTRQGQLLATLTILDSKEIQ